MFITNLTCYSTASLQAPIDLIALVCYSLLIKISSFTVFPSGVVLAGASPQNNVFSLHCFAITSMASLSGCGRKIIAVSMGHLARVMGRKRTGKCKS